ncbi:MAG: hypothetical protein ACI9VS_002973, partial [Candidatus Binatia bacterium]
SAMNRNEHSEILSMCWFLQGVFPKLEADDLREWQSRANAIASSVQVTDGQLDSYIGKDLDEIALLLLSEPEVHEWIVASAKTEARRDSMCCHPIPELLSLLLPDQTRRLAQRRCLELRDQPLGADDGTRTEMEYWCYVAGFTVAPNPEIYDWARERILQCPDETEPNFSVLRVWLRSASVGQIENDLSGPDANKLFSEGAQRSWALDGALDFDPRLISGDYDVLMKRLPVGFAGGIFLLSGRDDDLRRWGRELFSIVAKHLGNPPFNRSSRAGTRLWLSRDDEVKRVGFDWSADRSYNWTGNANRWNVEADPLEPVVKDDAQSVEALNSEFDLWKADQRNLQAWKHYDLSCFGASRALRGWAKQNSKEFLLRASPLLDVACEDPSKNYHIGGFLYRTMCCLLSLDPRRAWKCYVALTKGNMNHTVTSEYNVPQFCVELWNLERCGTTDHELLRRELFVLCQTDQEVMELCIAALANSAESRLLTYCDELLKNEIARERALGVSILAWIGSNDSATRLQRVAESDPSRWIRNHANWAYEVSLQEASCRSSYQRILRETDPIKVSAALQTIKPALNPSCYWWRFQLEDESEQAGLASPARVTALLRSFWYHFENGQKSDFKVFRRNPKKFCRGEDLGMKKCERMAPWWKLPDDFIR